MSPTLDELRARPDDRELLLVYADWLASQGHPRGELIVLQDAEQRCASADEFERARARAIELIEGEAELLPDVSMLPQQRAWAVWRGGFVRRLELLIDRPAPQPGAGLRGWSELLAGMLAHPSMALLDELLIRVDLRGEPIDETEAALAIVGDGVAGWRGESGPALLLALWTYRYPRSEQRDRLQSTLPGVRKLWYSTDITRIVPPSDSPIVALEQAIGDQLEIVWFDARGNFREQFIGTEPSLTVHVRHMAERRLEPMLARADPLPRRRIANFLDQLAARFDAPDGARLLAPRRWADPRPESIELALARRRLGYDRTIASVLTRFADVEWWWIEQRCDGRAWTGLCGLGSDQLLVLART